MHSGRSGVRHFHRGIEIRASASCIDLRFGLFNDDPSLKCEATSATISARLRTLTRSIVRFFFLRFNQSTRISRPRTFVARGPAALLLIINLNGR
jgi:hypothetical protein